MENILPYDGEAYYFGKILDEPQSAYYYSALMHEIQWANDKLILFGKPIITKREVGWYGDEAYMYKYSGTAKNAMPWTSNLLLIKSTVEGVLGEKFNSCLLNLYHSGEEGMGWHSDNEKELLPGAAIASVSMGAARRFDLRHKSSHEKVSIILENGSLLLMKGKTQANWQHRLAPAKGVAQGRINLTFRTMLPQEMTKKSYNV